MTLSGAVLSLEGKQVVFTGRLAALDRSQAESLVVARGWQRAGMVAPARTLQGVAFYDFRQVASMRTLVRLARSGVTIERIRHNLESLRRCLPSACDPLEQLTLLERDGKMLFRLEGGLL